MIRIAKIGHGGAQLALYIVLGLSALDMTIVNVALPVILKELHGANTDGQWINDAYTVIIAGFVMLASGLGDRHGRKLLFLCGIGLFIIGSLISAFAPGVLTLIAGRAVMGFGAAALLPASFALVSDIFPPDIRPIALGRGAVVAGAGLAIGPVLGGLLMAFIPWGGVFLIAVPLLLLAGYAGWRHLPDSRGHVTGGMDMSGALLSIIGLGGVVAGLIEGPRLGWTSPLILVLLAFGIASCAGFAAVERRKKAPLFDVGILANPAVSGAGACIFLTFFVFFTVIMFIPLYLTTVRGLSITMIGIVMMVPAVAYTVAVSRTSANTARHGARAVLLAGSTTAASGTALMFAAAQMDSDLPMIGGASLAFAGFGLISAPATYVLMSTLSAKQAGYGSSLYQIARQAGGTFGIAVLGSLYAEVYAAKIAAHLSGLLGSSDVAQASSSVAQALHLAHAQSDAALSATIKEAAAASFQSGYEVVLAVSTLLCLLVVAIALKAIPATAPGKAAET